MNRPLPELADIIAAAGHRFIDQPPAWFTWLHLKILLAIERCRTAAMGGHLDQCSGCGHRAISYNSCRNRHCPKCQSQARDRWLAARRAELLATPYAHVVFTLPHQLAPLALQNKEAIYGTLLRCSAQTLIEIAADPKRLGAEIGFFSVLHTWNQKHWVVYCKPPFGGPDQVLRYLGAYTHRVAISNHRLVSFVEDKVTFRWRDSAHKNKKRLLTLQVDEFLRRFLLHVLPRRFVRIRHFGFLASRRRGSLVPLCKKVLSADSPTTTPASTHSDTRSHPAPLWTCPLCGGSMLVVERLTALQIKLRSPPATHMA